MQWTFPPFFLNTIRVIDDEFWAISRGLGTYRELREACRICFPQPWYLSDSVVPNYLPISSWKGIFGIETIGGWRGESAAAPTGKSFRFVRACERAGARARREISYCYLEVFAKRTFSSSSARGWLFHFCDPKNAKTTIKQMVWALFEQFSV